MKTWSGAELAQFLASVRGDPLYPLWHLAAMTGLRRGELLGLKRCDVDLSRKLLVIRQTVIDVGGTCHVSKPKTNQGRRVVALDEETVRVIAAHMGCVNAESDAWLFSNGVGTHLSPGAVTRRFVQLSRDAGLPRIRLHDLRHTHATLALVAGVHPKIVSERLGHSTVAFTLDVYSHAIPHLQAEAAEDIARAVLRHSAASP
jgi:integrase